MLLTFDVRPWLAWNKDEIYSRNLGYQILKKKKKKIPRVQKISVHHIPSLNCWFRLQRGSGI